MESYKVLFFLAFVVAAAMAVDSEPAARAKKQVLVGSPYAYSAAYPYAYSAGYPYAYSGAVPAAYSAVAPAVYPASAYSAYSAFPYSGYYGAYPAVNYVR